MKLRVETTYTFVEEVFIDEINFPKLTDDEAFDVEMATTFAMLKECCNSRNDPDRISFTVHMIDDQEIIVRSGTKSSQGSFLSQQLT